MNNSMYTTIPQEIEMPVSAYVEDPDFEDIIDAYSKLGDEFCFGMGE